MSTTMYAFGMQAFADAPEWVVRETRFVDAQSGLHNSLANRFASASF
ncbi:hypothetical protein [Aquabacterium sp.]